MQTNNIVIEGRCVTREGLPLRLASVHPLLPFRTLKGWEELWDDIEGSLLLCEEEILHEGMSLHFVIMVEKVWTETWQATLGIIAPKTANPDLILMALASVGRDLEEISSRERLDLLTKALTFFGAYSTVAKFRASIPRIAVMAAIREASGAKGALPLCLGQEENALGDTGLSFLHGLLT